MMVRKHLFGCRGGEGLVQLLLDLENLGQAQRRRRNFLHYSTQFPFKNKTCTWKHGYGRHGFRDARDFVSAYNFHLLYLILIVWKVFYSVNNLSFKLYIIPVVSLYILRFILLFLEVLRDFNTLSFPCDNVAQF